MNVRRALKIPELRGQAILASGVFSRCVITCWHENKTGRVDD
jgi:hypothetical protein